MTAGAPLPPCAPPRAQLRISNIVFRLSTYFGSLYLDRVMGHEDSPDRVQLRASQLRSGAGAGRGPAQLHCAAGPSAVLHWARGPPALRLGTPCR